MASASGCSDCFSKLAATVKSVFLSKLLTVSTSVTSGLPLVKVPVLSKTIVLILQACSSGSPPLTKIPFSAPLPVPTIMAVGVAKPKAHGQAITITAVKAINAKDNVAPSTKYQTVKVMIAKTITTGTNQAEILSATA